MLKKFLFTTLLITNALTHGVDRTALIKICRYYDDRLNSCYTETRITKKPADIDGIPCKTFAELRPEDFKVIPGGHLHAGNREIWNYSISNSFPIPIWEDPEEIFLHSIIIAQANAKLLKNPNDLTALTRRFYAAQALFDPRSLFEKKIKVDFNIIPYYAKDDPRYIHDMPRYVDLSQKKPELPKTLPGPKVKLE